MSGGGAEGVIINLVEEYKSRGLEVDLLLIEQTGPYLADVPEDVRILRIGSEYELFWPIFSVLRLIRYLRNYRPDVLVSTLPAANFASILANNRANTQTRHVIRVANKPSDELGSTNTPFPHVKSVLIRLLYPRANHIIALSDGIKHDLADNFDIPEDLITILPNPKRIDSIIESADREPPPEMVFTEPVILAVGRLVEQKDFHTLIRAFHHLNKQRPSQLVILGEGPERESLMRLAEELGILERVCLPGFVDNPYKFMSNADMLVLSSRWEGFGNVLVEALACGTPVVSTSCSGPEFILESGRFGLLTPVGDHEALSKSMMTTIDNPPAPGMLRERATDFSIDRVISDYHTVLFNDKSPHGS